MIETRLPENLSDYHIHMIGIKGTGMAALAELLVSRGAHITGSDVSDEFYTDALLRKLHIKVTSPFAASNIPPSARLVVYSTAYTPAHELPGSVGSIFSAQLLGGHCRCAR